MSLKSLRVLLIEDSADDAKLIVHTLRRGGFAVSFERVQTAEGMEETLTRGEWDVVISDYSLPGFGGIAALEILKASGHDIPFIMVSGTIGEETAVAALKAGAHDFLLKGHLARLVPAIERELRDVADRREHVRAQIALCESEAKHRSLVERASVGICLVSTGGQFLTVNPALVAMLGYESQDELMAIALPALCDAAGMEAWDSLRQRSEFTGAEMLWRRKSGDLIRVRTSARSLTVPEFQQTVVELIAEDITERYRLEEQLRQAQKMEAIGRLAGGIAHDFNNLLTAILGYSEIVWEQVADRPHAAADLEEIRNAAKRASGLTRQLLVFSRKHVLSLQVLNLNDTISDLKRMLHRVIGEDIVVRTALTDSLHLIKADPSQIEQVLMNLVVNARDAMSRGGTITIETANASLPPDLRPLSPSSATYVSLTVRDTGCGMPPDVQNRIFEPFYTTKGPDKGTGLGLSTVFGIVTQSGGHITVSSKVDQGTTFTIYLPAFDGSANAASQEPAGTIPAWDAGRILLVEDDAPIRELAKKILARRGYSVLEADGAAAALTLVEEHQGSIDLLVTDIVMPGLSGPDMAQRIVALHPETRVLYISGYPDLALSSGSMSSRAALLQKPFAAQDLARKVWECLHVH